MDKLIKQLAKKYDISEFKVDLIVKSQFKVLKDIISDGDFKSLRLKHIGMFTVKKNRFKYYKNGRKKPGRTREEDSNS